MRKRVEKSSARAKRAKPAIVAVFLQARQPRKAPGPGSLRLRPKGRGCGRTEDHPPPCTCRPSMPRSTVAPGHRRRPAEAAPANFPTQPIEEGEGRNDPASLAATRVALWRAAP